jgi:TonB family protein
MIWDDTLYYPNGTLYCRKSYITTATGQPQQKFIECRDSTGKVLAENGNGYWIIYNNNFTRSREEGRVVNGLRDSTWTITVDNKDIKATYKDGKIAPRLNSAGEEIFTAVEQVPLFPGGLEAFSRFLSKNIVYPDGARINGIHGRVILSFVVETDGTLSDIKVARGIGGGCDEEALRVMKFCPLWAPGVQNGKPVRVAYNIPVNFTLN